ncbi:MAG: hypothetical protein Q7S06_03365 [Nanoarchaeota archaeon]|nr:hypothetical protein [Nanoarchaeota archaeon]
MPQTKEKIKVEVDAFYNNLGYRYIIEGSSLFISGWKTPRGRNSVLDGLNNDIRAKLDLLVALGTKNPDDYEVHRRIMHFPSL